MLWLASSRASPRRSAGSERAGLGWAGGRGERRHRGGVGGNGGCHLRKQGQTRSLPPTTTVPWLSPPPPPRPRRRPSLVSPNPHWPLRSSSSHKHTPQQILPPCSLFQRSPSPLPPSPPPSLRPTSLLPTMSPPSLVLGVRARSRSSPALYALFPSLSLLFVHRIQGFAQPANLTFTYPNVTGVSYAL